MDIQGSLSSPVWNRIEQLLRLIAGDPSQAERAVFTSAPVAVSDTVITVIQQAQDFTQVYSTALLTFTAGSGSGRRTLDGSAPTATGSQGVPVPAGGGTLEIHGADNIRGFRIIGETGQALSFTAELFQSAALPGVVRF